MPNQSPIDLDQLYWQDHTQNLCSRLLLSVTRSASIHIVEGPPGHGKSTIARWLYHRLEPEMHDVAYITLQKHESESGWLQPKLAAYLGLPQGPQGAHLFAEHLRSVHGKVLTIIIDNAHLLSTRQALDELVALCQIQALAPIRLNFVLFGNPQISQLIRDHADLGHYTQLICDLRALSRSELQIYLAQRIQDIGIARRSLVPESLALIAQHGVMTFAGVNALLEACMTEAYLREQKTISTDIVHAALETLGRKSVEEEAPKGKGSSRRRGLSSGKTSTNAVESVPADEEEAS